MSEVMELPEAVIPFRPEFPSINEPFPPSAIADELVAQLTDTPVRIVVAACKAIGFPVGDYGQKWGTKERLLRGVSFWGMDDELLHACGIDVTLPAPVKPAPVPRPEGLKPAPSPRPALRPSMTDGGKQLQAEALIAEAMRLMAGQVEDKPIDAEAVKNLISEQLTGVLSAVNLHTSKLTEDFQKAVANLKPVEVVREIIIDRRTEETRETTLSIDPALQKPLMACYNANIPVWLFGRPGTGKTTAARWLAEATGSQIIVYTCSVDTSSGDIIGRSIPSIHDGKSVWTASPILAAYGSDKKTIILIDEPTNAEAGAIKAINGMVQGDPIDTPDGTVVKGKDVYFLLADNTAGTGQTHQSSAAQRQDSSVLNRCRRIEVDYPVALEAKLVPVWVQKVAKTARTIIKENKLQAEMSLRQMLRMAALEEPLGREAAIRGELVDFSATWVMQIVAAGA